jgi:hypothetical protein
MPWCCLHLPGPVPKERTHLATFHAGNAAPRLRDRRAARDWLFFSAVLKLWTALCRILPWVEVECNSGWGAYAERSPCKQSRLGETDSTQTRVAEHLEPSAFDHKNQAECNPKRARSGVHRAPREWRSQG